MKKHTFKYDGKSACWSYLRQFYQLDVQQKYRLAPKITLKHIDLPGFIKQSVKVAFQTLSHTMHAGILTHVQSDPPTLPVQAAETANLLAILNDLSDSVNGSQIKSGNKYKCAITNNSVHIKYYTQMIKWFSTLKVINNCGKNITNQMQFIQGWQITLSSFIGLWEQLSNNNDFEYILPRRLNQDPIENLFSILRRKGGSSDNPTPIMFGRLFRQSFSTELLKVSKSTNCQDDEDSFLVLLGDISFNSTPESNSSNSNKCTSINYDFNLNPQTNILNLNLDLDMACETICNDNYNDDNLSVGEENGSNYVFGYVLRYLINIHSCISCTTLLISKNTTVDDRKHLYTYLKAYSVKNKVSSFGNMFIPTQLFYNYLMTCETIFHEYFTIHASDNKIVENLCNRLQNIKINGICKDYPYYKIIQFFIKLRIDYTLKFSNREFAICPKKQRKLLKVNAL